ncbi:MAG: metalloregulator ArsR/SmtB family transcription factor [Actinomycetota bacterium]|nr:metalloregulator ArsR/SmtB family transcription factor [Actinomycetota bacterium]
MHANIDDFVMPDPADVEAVAGRLRLLGDPTRLKILCALVQGESHVACLADLAGAGVATVSQHLAKLRLAGIVHPRRDGQHMIYELVDVRVRQLVGDLLAPTASRQPKKPVVGAVRGLG